MKLDELIPLLTDIRDQMGNLPVRVDGKPITGIWTKVDDDREPGKRYVALSYGQSGGCS